MLVAHNENENDELITQSYEIIIHVSIQYLIIIQVGSFQTYWFIVLEYSYS